MSKRIINISAVTKGGAGNYAVTFHRLLIEMGYESFFFTKENVKDIPNVIVHSKVRHLNLYSRLFRILLNKLMKESFFDPKYFFYNRYEFLDPISKKQLNQVLALKPDVVFVHWVSGFLNARLINFLSKVPNLKVIIIMLDNAYLTGGCHYPWNCKGFNTQCERCPAIKFKPFQLLAKKNFDFKRKYSPVHLPLVVCSFQDASRVRSSALFSTSPLIKMIEFVDENKFKPSTNKTSLRDKYGIPNNKRVILFGATFLNEERKGMHELFEALRYIRSENFFIISIGQKNNVALSHEIKQMGFVNEAELIELYQLSDLFVCPSIEDSGPIMINQAMMCGTAVVAFHTGVAIDLVIDGKTGFLADNYSSQSLAVCIDRYLELDDKMQELLSFNCRSLAINTYSIVSSKEKIRTLINKKFFLHDTI